MLTYITRGDQLQTMGIGTPTTSLIDDLFDGVDIPKGVTAAHWVPENSVHHAMILSSEIASTRNFIGPQTNIVRDEVRGKTWVAYIEQGNLVLAEVNQGSVTRTILGGPNVWRSHIALDKYSGAVHAVWIQNAGGTRTLWLDGTQISTAATDPDFPFMDLSQAPIGHMQTLAPSFGMISYKDRSNGRLYYRLLSSIGGPSGTTVGSEQTLVAPTVLGGASFAISGSDVIVRVDAITNGVIVPRTATSSNSGQTFTAFTAIPLPFSPGFTPIPSPRPVTDYEGFFHVPIGVTNGTEALSADIVIGQAIVESTDVPSAFAIRDKLVLQAFPKKPDISGGVALRFGNGITDGLGLIMVTQSAGRLYTSNSQAGGILFPPSAHLNHEMPSVAAFDSTECYTMGVVPNTVSMDYTYIELDPATMLPVSGALIFETWDMPLPIPVVTATASGSDVAVVIVSDANFSSGDTTFLFDEPGVGITNVAIADARNATVSTDTMALVGKHIRFRVLNVFYYHEGVALIQ